MNDTCVRPFVSVIRCPPLEVVNSNVNTSDVIYETYANVSCRTGFEFDTNETWTVTQCKASQKWSPQPTNCTGKWSESDSTQQVADQIIISSLTTPRSEKLCWTPHSVHRIH